MRYIPLSVLSLFFLFLGACSSSMTIMTDPPDVEVYAGQRNTDEPVLLGKTPLQISETEITEKIKIDPDRFSFLELTLKKTGYDTEKIWLPSRGWDTQQVTVNVVMKETGVSGSVLDVLIKLVFNAQKFAETRQYEQALIALDKALEMAPRFSRAMSMKAAIFFLQKNYDESTVWYKKALEIDPGHNESIKMLDQIRQITNQ